MFITFIYYIYLQIYVYNVANKYITNVCILNNKQKNKIR